MMKKTKFKSRWALRGLALAIVALGGGAIIHIPVVASTLSEIKVSETQSGSESPNDYPDKAFVAVDEAANYIGGPNQLLEDLSETIKYPEEAKEKGIQGRVVVRFIVNTHGDLSDISVVRPINPQLDAAAIEAVKNLPGKWLPGKVNGKFVDSYYNMPVTFKLKGDSEKTK